MPLMINLIKMDLFHLFKTRSLYITWGILILTLVVTTFALYSELSFADTPDGEVTTTSVDEMGIQTDTTDPDNLEIGMTVILPIEAYKRVTVYHLFFGNCQGKTIALFLCIFTVLFSTSDLRSGYIKNIAGQVKNKYPLLLSKAVALFIFMVSSLLLTLLVQGLANRIFFGYVDWGIGRDFLTYLAIQCFLHFALCLIIMIVSVIARSNVLGIVFAIFVCFNVFSIIYGLIDKLAANMGYESFRTVMHTVSGKIALMPPAPQAKDILSASVTALLFVLIVFGAGSTIFQKRDIN